MSTRATYKFVNTEKNLKVQAKGYTFYIHHDGYPAGAAMYFNNALDYEAEAPNSTIVDKFMRSNDRAELTEDHESHGDTEYRYTYDVRNDKLFVYERNMENYHEDEWNLIFYDNLEKFINENPELIKE